MSWFKKGLKAISPLAMALNKENSVKIAAGGVGAGYSNPKQMAGGAAAGAMSPQQLAGGIGARAAERRRGENNNFSQQMLALQPGFVNTAMDPGIAEYQTPAAGNDKMPYDPQAAAKFKAAIQKNMAQRPQMGQQMGQVAGPGGVQNAMRVFSPEEQQSFAQRTFAGGPNARMPQFGMRNPPFYNPPPEMQPMPGGFNMGELAQTNEPQPMPQQPQPQQQQAQPQKGGANAGRVRQSAGIYKDPRTGALYGNNGKLMRAGTGRMR